MYKMECDAGVPAVPGGGVGVPGEGVLHHRLLLLPAAPALQDQREEMLDGPLQLLLPPLPAPQNKLPKKVVPKTYKSNLRLFRQTEKTQFAFYKAGGIITISASVALGDHTKRSVLGLQAVAGFSKVASSLTQPRHLLHGLRFPLQAFNNTFI
jgi:hypothetical protein